MPPRFSGACVHLVPFGHSRSVSNHPGAHPWVSLRPLSSDLHLSEPGGEHEELICESPTCLRDDQFVFVRKFAHGNQTAHPQMGNLDTIICRNECVTLDVFVTRTSCSHVCGRDYRFTSRRFLL